MTSPLHGEGRVFESHRAHRLFFQSGARIKPEAEDSEDEELHNSSEKLCNFGIADNNESLARIMTDRYVDEEGNEKIEMLWEELVPEEGDEVEWDKKNDPYMLKAEARLRKALKRQREEEAHEQAAAAQVKRNLTFTKDELDRFVGIKVKGLVEKSQDWIYRSSEALWAITQGEISPDTVNALRDSVLEKLQTLRILILRC